MGVNDDLTPVTKEELDRARRQASICRQLALTADALEHAEWIAAAAMLDRLVSEVWRLTDMAKHVTVLPMNSGALSEESP